MESRCQDCRHCTKVFDPSCYRNRGACTLVYCMVGLESRPCPAFEPKVPQTPYIPREQAQRLLDVMLVQEIRSALLNVENLLKALELQPTPTERGQAWARQLLRAHGF